MPPRAFDHIIDLVGHISVLVSAPAHSATELHRQKCSPKIEASPTLHHLSVTLGRDFDVKPVSEMRLREEVQDGAAATRIVVDKVPNGFRLIVWSDKSDIPFTVLKRRGGTRVWAQIGFVIAWIERNLARRTLSTVVLHLPPDSEGQSSPTE